MEEGLVPWSQNTRMGQWQRDASLVVRSCYSWRWSTHREERAEFWLVNRRVGSPSCCGCPFFVYYSS